MYIYIYYIYIYYLYTIYIYIYIMYIYDIYTWYIYTVYIYIIIIYNAYIDTKHTLHDITCCVYFFLHQDDELQHDGFLPQWCFGHWKVCSRWGLDIQLVPSGELDDLAIENCDFSKLWFPMAITLSPRG